MTATKYFETYFKESNDSTFENFLKAGADAFLYVGVILAPELKGENIQAHMENVWANLGNNWLKDDMTVDEIKVAVFLATLDYIRYVKIFRA